MQYKYFINFYTVVIVFIAFTNTGFTQKKTFKNATYPLNNQIYSDSVTPVKSITNNNHNPQQIKLTGKIISGDMITISYKTLEGNNPFLNKNWIAIWQGSQIHYHEKPLRKILLKNTKQDGDIVFDSLQISNLKYTVGFGASDDISRASSTLFFSKKKYNGIPFSSSLKIIDIGSNFVVIAFETPLGNSPLINKNWVAIWQGKIIPENCNTPLTKNYIQTNTASGYVAINYMTLIRNQWYTIAYSTGPSCVDIITSYTFLYQ